MPRPEVFKLVADDETPSDGLNQKSMDKMEYRKYLAIKKAQYGKKTFPSKRREEKPRDEFPDVVEVSAERINRYDTGASTIEPSAMRSKFHQKKFEKTKETYVARAETTARAEILNKEEQGFIETEDGEVTYTIQQREIANAADLASAAKQFELLLENFGPYKIAYTSNGRHLLLGGKRGHIAAFDWQTKALHCEFNTTELIRDVTWLHTENIFAVAQKHYTYVYDNTGTELHCIKTFPEACRLEFLPRHFLLVAGSKNSWLNYLDVSVGKKVASFCTKKGPLDVMCQNPANAIIHTGHGNGTVSLWSPNVNEPLVTILAHASSVQGITVDETGKYMVTTGLDRKCRIWDVRMYKQVHAYTLPFGLNTVTVSQRMTVACGVGNTVQTFTDMHLGSAREPYVVHKCHGNIADLSFVPYEDVLGVGHAGGFSSMLVPGCGEANVDALRLNPYETKSQRKEREVKQLLDKLQADLICIDPAEITRVNESLLEDAMEERKKILYVRPLDVQYTPKHKMRGRGGGGHKEMRKQLVKEDIRVSRNKDKEEAERELLGRGAGQESTKPKHILDRFKS